MIMFRRHIFFLKIMSLLVFYKTKGTYPATPRWANATSGVKQKHRFNSGNNSCFFMMVKPENHLIDSILGKKHISANLNKTVSRSGDIWVCFWSPVSRQKPIISSYLSQAGSPNLALSRATTNLRHVLSSNLPSYNTPAYKLLLNMFAFAISCSRPEDCV